MNGYICNVLIINELCSVFDRDPATQCLYGLHRSSNNFTYFNKKSSNTFTH